MYDLLQEVMADGDICGQAERRALEEFIKRRGEYEIFSYHSRLATYLAARQEGDRMRALIDLEVFERAVAECTEMGFETEAVAILETMYRVTR